MKWVRVYLCQSHSFLEVYQSVSIMDSTYRKLWIVFHFNFNAVLMSFLLTSWYKQLFQEIGLAKLTPAY